MSNLAPTSKPEAPLVPVFLPAMLLLCCVCLPTTPLLVVSKGQFGFASMLMNGSGVLTTFVMSVGLVLTRSRSQIAKYVRWVAYALALGVAVWIIVRHHLMVDGALQGVDEGSRATIARMGSAEQPWVYLAAILSLVPALLGGMVGARWIESRVR